MGQVRCVVLVLIAVMVSFAGISQAEDMKEHAITDFNENWRLGVQTWTFRKFTLYESIDKIAELGLNWMECFPGQTLSKDDPIKFNHDAPPIYRAMVKKKLAENNIRVVCYGVVGLPNNEQGCRKVFEFAKDMGIENIASEPPLEAIDMIDRLAQEYEIHVAFHNHPKRDNQPGYIYWSPDKVMELCEGRSKWLGLSADTGHWTRSGIKPIDAIKQTHHRIKYFHLKDLNEFGKRNAHDTIWGTGASGFDEFMRYLDRVGWNGVMSIEYEHNWDNSLPEIKQCVAHFNEIAQKLNGSGWHYLFDEDLDNARFKPGSWTYEGGVLTRQGGGYIWSEKQYGDFILDLEFKIAEKGNSGIFFRTGDTGNPVQTSFEFQILDEAKSQPKNLCGSIYDCLPPKVKPEDMAGQWHHVTIKAEGPMIYAVMDGKPIIRMNTNDWTEPEKNPDGSKNKFKTAIKDFPRQGYIGLQDHKSPVWFRNIKVRSLD